MWGVQKTHNLTKEYTYRVRTLIWPFYFNLDLCVMVNVFKKMNKKYINIKTPIFPFLEHCELINKLTNFFNRKTVFSSFKCEDKRSQ